MVCWDRSPFDAIDQGGKSAEDFSDDHALLISSLRLLLVGLVAFEPVPVVPSTDEFATSGR